MAGLNFVGNAYYPEERKDKQNISPFEFIPWILGQCATIGEAKDKLANINLVDIPFSKALPQAQLHWIIAGHGQALTVESTESGLHVYDNLTGVLTNNPPFDEQMFSLNNYMYLSTREPENRFCNKLPLQTYSRGMGPLDFRGTCPPSPVSSGRHL